MICTVPTGRVSYLSGAVRIKCTMYLVRMHYKGLLRGVDYLTSYGCRKLKMFEHSLSYDTSYEQHQQYTRVHTYQFRRSVFSFDIGREN